MNANLGKKAAERKAPRWSPAEVRDISVDESIVPQPVAGKKACRFGRAGPAPDGYTATLRFRRLPAAALGITLVE